MNTEKLIRETRRAIQEDANGPHAELLNRLCVALEHVIKPDIQLERLSARYDPLTGFIYLERDADGGLTMFAEAIAAVNCRCRNTQGGLFMQHVATTYTMEALIPGGAEVTHVCLHRPLPKGTKLFNVQLTSSGGVSFEGWRQTIGEAASQWLHDNDPGGLDWCDSRNIDALLDAMLGSIDAK